MGKEAAKAFESVCAVLLGKNIGTLEQCAPWLGRNVLPPIERTANGKSVYIPDMLYYNAIKERLVDGQSAQELGKKSITQEQARALSLSGASKTLAAIKTTTSDVSQGKNIAVEKAAAYGMSHYCSNGTFFVSNKYCAYCFWPRQSEYAFGSVYLFSSKFCMNCYYSSALTRCFEVSDSNRCTDCYYCHNCENLQDCMFCFNVKSKRYAVCNVELGREKYMALKKSVLAEISGKLEKEHSLSLGIYNLGCGGKA